MIQNCSACGSLATARFYLYLRLFCVSISSLAQYRMNCWNCFAQYVTVMSKEYYFRFISVFFSGGCSAVSMVSNCRMSPKIWQRSSLIWILPNYPVLHKYKWKRIQVQIQVQVKFKPQIQAKITRKQYICQLVVIAFFYPPELSSAVLWTNPSFTATVRLNLILDSCILKVFPSIASYVVNGDK